MTYRVEQLEDYPAVLLAFEPEFKMGRDAEPALSECMALFNAASEPLYWINEMTEVNFGFSDVVAGLASFTRGDLAVVKHPNFRELLVVTNSSTLKMATNALGQAQYGGISAHVFESLDEVFAYMED